MLYGFRRIEKEIKSSLAQVISTAQRTYYGDIQNANADKLRSVLSEADTFGAFTQQIMDIKCMGEWPLDDAKKVDALIKISDNLNRFLLTYAQGTKDKEPLQDYELKYLQDLLHTTNKSLLRAQTVCEAKDSYKAVSADTAKEISKQNAKEIEAKTRDKMSESVEKLKEAIKGNEAGIEVADMHIRHALERGRINSQSTRSSHSSM